MINHRQRLIDLLCLNAYVKAPTHYRQKVTNRLCYVIVSMGSENIIQAQSLLRKKKRLKTS